MSAQKPARQLASPAAPFVGGNEARLLVDGPQAHGAMFEAMAAARDHINLETYILDAGAPGQRLQEILARKRAQGVRVQLLYDGVGSIDTPREYFDRLRERGVAVCEFNPVARRPGKLNNRDHRKILVVDGRIAFTGGINISRTYASSSRKARRESANEEEKQEDGWRDTQIEVRGPVVAQVQRLFLDAWAQQGCKPPAEAPPEARYFPAPERPGSMQMRVLRSDPEADRSEMYGALLEAIREARRRVWLTVGYFVPDPATRQALIDAAQRGADVRLVLPGFSDFWAPVYAGRSHYAELLAAGVRIHEWREALMHAKTAVIDSQWSAVGSTNLDWRSFVHNYEADVVIRDAGFAAQMERRFLADVDAAVQIDAEAWRRRGALEKMKEWLARQWEYLL